MEQRCQRKSDAPAAKDVSPLELFGAIGQLKISGGVAAVFKES